MASCTLTYRFFIEVDALTIQVYPIYSGDLSKQVTQEPGEVFFREKINGSFKFVRGDFDYLYGLSIEKEIIFTIQRYDTFSGLGFTYWQGVFYKTDIEFTVEDGCGGGGVAEVTPQPRDEYEKILEGIDKEFNLIELAPAITPISYTKKAILQVYINGGDFIQNYVDGNYWEAPVEPTYNDGFNVMINTYKFSAVLTKRFIPGAGNISPDVSGYYDFTTLLREDGHYQIRYTGAIWEIIDKFNADQIVYTGGAILDGIAPFTPGDTFTSNFDPGSRVQVQSEAVFARLLTNASTIGGSPTSDFPANDFTGENYAYEKVIGVSIDVDLFVASDGHSTTPGRYGVFADDAVNFAGQYFTKPSIPVGANNIYPLGRSQWAHYSFWLAFDDALLTTLEEGDDALTLRDAYKLPDVLTVLLGAIDPDLTHEEAAEYSDFFYGASNVIRGAVKYPVITPKSNIIFGDYDQPAQKAPIRLSDILNFLKRFYKVFWWIDDGKLKLEHLEYFELGKDYATPQIGVDLTTSLEPKTGKNWGYGANKFRYEKSEMPERFEFSWMDDSTTVFDGVPIDITSIYVQKGQIEEVNLSPFTADITHIQVSPGDIARDGFVWMDAVDDGGGGLEIPFADITFDGETFKLQNGYMTLVHAHDQYYNYQMPATDVTINGTATTAGSVIKRKIQELTYPATTQPDPMELITTALGDGRARELDINLTTGAIKIIIRHATE